MKYFLPEGAERGGGGPGSDDCNSAPALTEGTAHTGTTVGATLDGTATCGASSATPDLWYAYTPPADGSASFTMCGSGYDTVLSIHSGPCGAQLACNDDFCGLQSGISGLPVVGGTTYWVRVSGFSGQTGSYTLTVTRVGGGGAGGADDCNAAVEALEDTAYNGSTVGATTDGAAPCGASTGPDHWFFYTPPADGLATISLCGSGYDCVLSIHDSPCGASLACNDDSCGLQSQISGFSVVGGTTYYIRISGFAGGSGSYTMIITRGDPPEDPCTVTNDQNFCQDRNTADANNSTIGIWNVADEYTFATSGFLDNICFWGGFLPAPGPIFGTFQVNFYVDNAGGPGTLVASFVEGVNLTLNGPEATGASIAGVTPEYAYSATLSPAVPVIAGECYWLEIVQDTFGQGSFFWSQSASGNGNINALQHAGGTPGVYNPAGDQIPNDMGWCLSGAGMVLDTAFNCSFVPPPPENDSCSNPTPVSENVTVNFCNVGATTDGPDEPGLCNFFGDTNVGSDIWYCYTASADGLATVTFCGSGYDTKVAIYNGCACPVGESAIACNDDACGLQSQVAFSVTGGNSYMIRVGGFAGSQGCGLFTITLGAPPVDPCTVTNDQNFCQDRNTVDANNSTLGIFVVADEFNSATTGSIDDICFWGGFLPAPGPIFGTFQVNIYDDSGAGTPGTLLASFTEGVNLTLNGPEATGASIAGVTPEYAYSATLSPAVAVNAGECYWLEIVQDTFGQGSFFWSQSASGNGNINALQSGGGTPGTYNAGEQIANDMGWCLSGPGFLLDTAFNCSFVPPAPENDSCANPIAVTENVVVNFCNLLATTDGPNEPGLCNFFGDTNVGSDIWYCYTASATGNVLVDLCGSSYDTKVAIYNGCACPVGESAIACNDDVCGLQSQVSFAAVQGNSYMIRVGGFAGSQGCGVMLITNDGVAVPVGACCIDVGGGVFICIPDQTESDCASAGGVWQGDGVSCEDVNDCQPIAEGACCLFVEGCPSDCFIATEADCNNAGGSFQGGGTDCSSCPEFNPCDWNGDGSINTADFFEFFAAFFGTPPDADYNGDGDTNTADFFGFFGCFFATPPGSQTFCP